MCGGGPLNKCEPGWPASASSNCQLPDRWTCGNARTLPSRMEGALQPEQDKPRYRPGSVEDFDRLYEATYDRLFATLILLLRDRAAAEDCVQDAFLRAFKAWPRWQPDAPAEVWLHRIAINVALSHRRRERLREVGEVIRRIGVPADPDPTDSPSHEL